MLGAIAGDICGAPWEGGQCANGEFQLFAEGASITDDSVCTVAIAQALMQHGDAVQVAESLRTWCKRYPGLGYGSAFNHWVYSRKGPYNSWGNGGAMRVSPCGWLAESLEEAESLAELTARVTHNHPEGLRGAKAVASAIWLARQGLTGDELSDRLAARYGYNLQQSFADLIAASSYSTEAVDTVPIALMCATRASHWEEAIAFAALIGGDTDTLGAMAGAIAEARFGLPEAVVNASWAYLPEDMREVVHSFYDRVGGIKVAQTLVSKEPGLTQASLWQRLLSWFR